MTYETNEAVLVVLLVFLFAPGSLPNLRHGGPQQPRAKNKEHPREARDQRGAEQDEGEPEQQGNNDAEQQRLLLILPGHPERLEDENENEEVVDRERPLHRPACVELLRVQPPVRQPDTDAEEDGEPHVEKGPSARLSGRRRMRVACVPEEVDDDESDGDERQDPPRPRVNNHEYLLTIRPGNFIALRRRCRRFHGEHETRRAKLRP